MKRKISFIVLILSVMITTMHCYPANAQKKSRLYWNIKSVYAVAKAKVISFHKEQKTYVEEAIDYKILVEDVLYGDMTTGENQATYNSYQQGKAKPARDGSIPIYPINTGLGLEFKVEKDKSYIFVFFGKKDTTYRVTSISPVDKEEEIIQLLKEKILEDRAWAEQKKKNILARKQAKLSKKRRDKNAKTVIALVIILLFLVYTIHMSIRFIIKTLRKR